MAVDELASIARANRPLLVASSGGHLEELHQWAHRWSILNDRRSTWVTFQTSQSESLLGGQDVVFVPYVAPRDLKNAAIAVRHIYEIVARRNSDVIISTGSAVAVAAALVAKARSIPMVYIESLARVESFSLTGKIMKWLPWVTRFTQSPLLRGPRFAYSGSMLDGYRVTNTQVPPFPLRVTVTIGTIKPYGFDALLKHLEPLLRAHDVTWQIGESTFRPDHGAVHEHLGRTDLLDSMANSDVVISHAGVGSIMSALSVGRVPVVVPRTRARREHVDDHQRAIATLLAAQNLVIYSELEDISTATLVTAAAMKAEPDG